MFNNVSSLISQLYDQYFELNVQDRESCNSLYILSARCATEALESTNTSDHEYYASFYDALRKVINDYSVTWNNW